MSLKMSNGFSRGTFANKGPNDAATYVYRFKNMQGRLVSTL